MHWIIQVEAKGKLRKIRNTALPQQHSHSRVLHSDSFMWRRASDWKKHLSNKSNHPKFNALFKLDLQSMTLGVQVDSIFPCLSTMRWEGAMLSRHFCVGSVVCCHLAIWRCLHAWCSTQLLLPRSNRYEVLDVASAPWKRFKNERMARRVCHALAESIEVDEPEMYKELRRYTQEKLESFFFKTLHADICAHIVQTVVLTNHH